MIGPCEWNIDYSVCGNDDGVPTAIGQLTDEQRQNVEAAAVEYLWRWTGRQFGTCTVTVRPCRRDCTRGLSTFTGWGRGGDPLLPSFGGSPFRPALLNGRWTNIGCGRCGDLCGCDSTPALRLAGRVAEISEIVIDGDVLPADAYRVDNGSLLVRTDGGEWPTCQDLDAPSEPGSEDAAGTWQVTYRAGIPAPTGGQLAAGLLATEFAKALCRDSSCALPKRVQSITRQGVTVAVLDAFDDIDTGHTGIWMIDSWIASVTKAPARARVYSPDRPRSRFRHTTWKAPQA